MTDAIKKDEPKTERFNMFMSPSEMKAIDDWAWRNKIRSKSEAVRRLCQIALTVGGELNSLADSSLEITNQLTDLDSSTFEFWVKIASPVFKSDTLNREAVSELLYSVLDVVDQITDRADHLSSALIGVDSAISALAHNERDEGDKLRGEALRRANEEIVEMRELRLSSRKNREAMRELGYKQKSTGGDSK